MIFQVTRNAIYRRRNTQKWNWRSAAVAAIILWARVLSPVRMAGQNPAAASPSLAEGQKTYAERCVGCHGADARGTDQAPGLAGNSRVSGQTVQKIRDVIRNGIPRTGMPGFDLPARELDAL